MCSVPTSSRRSIDCTYGTPTSLIQHFIVMIRNVHASSLSGHDKASRHIRVSAACGLKSSVRLVILVIDMYLMSATATTPIVQ